MATIRLETIPALAEALGFEKPEKDLELPGDGGTVKEVLERLCAVHQRVGEIVFDREKGALTGQVIIFLNNRHLDLEGGLDTIVKDGDRLSFIPFVEGG